VTNSNHDENYKNISLPSQKDASKSNGHPRPRPLKRKRESEHAQSIESENKDAS